MPPHFLTPVPPAAAILAWACFATSLSADFRTPDGSNNNTANPTWGSFGQNLQRLTPPAYSDGYSTPSGADRPAPRLISNAIFDQTEDVPDPRNLTDFVWAWGQFVDHDMDLAPDSSGEVIQIEIPPGDPWFVGVTHMPMHRSGYNPSTSTPGIPREQANMLTSWIDGSNVYGSTADRATWLRTFEGGKLKTTPHPTGDLLPFNDGTQDNAMGPSTHFFVAGDIRANEQAGLTCMHTLFLREHNYWADRLATDMNLTDDEEIYQWARKIVGAQIQAISYNQWLPALLGDNAMNPYAGYDSVQNPTIFNEFAHAGFRFGHSMVSNTLFRYTEDGSEHPAGHVHLKDAFFNPSVVQASGIDPFFRGFARTVQQQVDARVINDLRNFLFGDPGAGGLDLVSLNIMRGREHGLADFNTIRTALGLAPYTDFNQISSDPAVANALASTYGSVDKIDMWVGCLAEDRAPGSSVGQTIKTLLIFQFELLRNCDRYFYKNDPDMLAHPALLDEINNTTLADIIRRNTNIVTIQDNVFVLNSCPADYNLDTEVNFFDLLDFLNAWFASDADFNQSGTTDFMDLLDFLDAWFAGC